MECIEIRRMAGRIAALEARAEARVTLLDEWAVVDKNGHTVNRIGGGIEAKAWCERYAEQADAHVLSQGDAPHRVVQVALVDASAPSDETPAQVHICGGSGALSDPARQEIDDFATYLRLKERFDIRRVRTASSAETRQPVAWWIGPHDGLLAGATTNKSLADARIEHGATVRPLVFGDVATEAKAGVTEADVERIARALHEESENPITGAARIRWNNASPYWQDKMRRMARAALTGGASDGE
jgi:hypothetical protein